MILLVDIFGVTISLKVVVSALVGVWELFGRIFPTKAENPPTPVGWFVSFLNWLNNSLNIKK